MSVFGDSCRREKYSIRYLLLFDAIAGNTQSAVLGFLPIEKPLPVSNRVEEGFPL